MKTRHVRHVTLMGKRWRLRFVRGLKEKRAACGEIDPPNQAGKEIRIDASLVGEELCEVILHELLHGCDWWRSEEAITQTAHDLARAVWRLRKEIFAEARRD